MTTRLSDRRPDDATFEFGDPLSERKLRNLVLYIAAKCASHKRFGTVKLNKNLFFSDIISYAVTGSPITGVEYLALDAGPAPRRMPEIKQAMIVSGEIAEQIVEAPGGYTEKRIVATTKPDLSLFSAQEIAIVDFVIEQTRRKTASDVSYISHGLPWRIGRKATGSIPYEAVFVSNARPTEYLVARSRELVEKFNWDN